MIQAPRKITDLSRLVLSLHETERRTFERLFEVVEATGSVGEPSEDMRSLFEHLGGGSIERVRKQRIVRITNRHTGESALFNGIRSSRPLDAGGEHADEVLRTIRESEGQSCDFCNWETRTPADLFLEGGRLHGRRCVTASNVAKFDGFHSVLVFDRHDPLTEIDEERLADYFQTARRWADAAQKSDSEARYYLLVWNALWRAAGSKIHGHMQMTVARSSHYAPIERLRSIAAAFRSDGRDYFDDLVAAHGALGLARKVDEAHVLASLTPVKERELIFVAPPGGDENSLIRAIVRGLSAYRRSGAMSWNFALFLPPLVPTGVDWTAFRAHAHLVDRGDPASRTSDIGAMELYAASVVSADPFQVVAELDADPT